MENCLFVANLPHCLNNYEMTIALYLLFSKYGKVVVVKASRDNSHRPFGFVEFTNDEMGRRGALSAIETNCLPGSTGIIIGGRRVRLEIAKNTCKILIKIPFPADLDKLTCLLTDYSTIFNCSLKLLPLSHNNNEYVLCKLENASDPLMIVQEISKNHPNWIIQNKSNIIIDTPGGMIPTATATATASTFPPFVAESYQRQSGLFQLRIPETGVLPITPMTLAKIHGSAPFLQYSFTTSPSPPILPPSHSHNESRYGCDPILSSPTPIALMKRLYEDWTIINRDRDGDRDKEDPIRIESVYDNSADALEAASRLTPPLGDSKCDVFFGRLDNQRVTLETFHDHLIKYGQIDFLRLCNRSITREDKVPVDSTAFVRFSNEEDALKCIAGENGSTWLGRIIKCEKCWNFLGRITPPNSN